MEDGTRITYIPHVMWDRIPILQAFAIGNHAVTGDGEDVFENDGERDVKDWGRLYERDEGVRWCRGWNGEAADALRAAASLALEHGQMLYSHVSR